MVVYYDVVIVKIKYGVLTIKCHIKLAAAAVNRFFTFNPSFLDFLWFSEQLRFLHFLGETNNYFYLFNVFTDGVYMFQSFIYVFLIIQGLMNLEVITNHRMCY